MIHKISRWVLVMGYEAAGVNHFWHAKFYVDIMPSYMPWKEALVAGSGVAEIVLGLLLIPKYTRRFAAYMIALMLVAFLPVHIWMLGPEYRTLHPQFSSLAGWIRLLLQPVLIVWVLTQARKG